MGTALVTGATSGLGLEIAWQLAQARHDLVLVARTPERLREVAEEMRQFAGVQVETLQADLSERDELELVAERLREKSKPVGLLVNNAGYGSYGAIEDVPIDEARRQFEVNVFGLGRLTQLVTPHMRTQGSGTIINISSMGGKLTTPLGGWYHATKYAVEALSDALRMELRPFGIDVVVVEPGAIRTAWWSIAADHLEATAEGSAYADQIRAVAGAMRSESNSRRYSPPEVIARTIGKIVTARHPRTRYAVGFMAKPLIAARRVLPDRAFDQLIGAAFGFRR